MLRSAREYRSFFQLNNSARPYLGRSHHYVKGLRGISRAPATCSATKAATCTSRGRGRAEVHIPLGSARHLHLMTALRLRAFQNPATPQRALACCTSSIPFAGASGVCGTPGASTKLTCTLVDVFTASENGRHSILRYDHHSNQRPRHHCISRGGRLFVCCCPCESLDGRVMDSALRFRTPDLIGSRTVCRRACVSSVRSASVGRSSAGARVWRCAVHALHPQVR